MSAMVNNTNCGFLCVWFHCQKLRMVVELHLEKGPKGLKAASVILLEHAGA
jgi:hypothetical protein